MYRGIQTLALGGLVLATLLALGCATNQSASSQLSDSAISAKIETKLAGDPDINPFNIDVDTNEGIVTLSGAVDKDFARDEAERLARSTDGVKDVMNDVTVRHRSVEERVDDAWIVTKVKSKHTADPELNPFNIHVDSKDGVVTLTGRVESKSDSDEAEKLARDTKGVRSVKNRLEVGPSS